MREENTSEICGMKCSVPRFSPIAEMSISNGSSNQALQVGHAHLRSSRWFPRENRGLQPQVAVHWQRWKNDNERHGMSNRTQIRSDYWGTQAHQTKALLESFATKVRTFSSSEALPIASIVFLCSFPRFANSLSKSSFACSLPRPVRKSCDNFPSGGGGEEVKGRSQTSRWDDWTFLFFLQLGQLSVFLAQRCVQLLDLTLNDASPSLWSPSRASFPRQSCPPFASCPFLRVEACGSAWARRLHWSLSPILSWIFLHWGSSAWSLSPSPPPKSWPDCCVGGRGTDVTDFSTDQFLNFFSCTFNGILWSFCFMAAPLVGERSLLCLFASRAATSSAHMLMGPCASSP